MTLNNSFLDIQLIEWVGYVASVIVTVSFLMSSMIKLRIINLVGAVLFAIYGFYIGSYPVAVVNVLIALFNIYHLWKLRSLKEDFSIIEMTKGSVFLEKFLERNGRHIKKAFPEFKFDEEQKIIGFYILRNMTTAGIFMATPNDEKTLKVLIDYVEPSYRDFQVGLYIHHQLNKYFISKGYRQLLSTSSNKKHTAYLQKMGYKEMEIGGVVSYLKIFGSK